MEEDAEVVAITMSGYLGITLKPQSYPKILIFKMEIKGGGADLDCMKLSNNKMLFFFKKKLSRIRKDERRM